MTEIADDNLGFVECWNEILTPKWIRFRHLLSGTALPNMKNSSCCLHIRFMLVSYSHE